MQERECSLLIFFPDRTSDNILQRGLGLAMKMVWAVLPPEAADHVVRALHVVGTSSLIRFPVTGYGREPDPAKPPAVRKELLLIVVPDNIVAKTVILIRMETKAGVRAAGGEKTSVDGKIFVTYIDDAFAIRTFGTEREDGP